MPTPTSAPNPSSRPSTSEVTTVAPEREYAWQVAHILGASFRYASQGITYAFRTQRNFRIHVLATISATRSTNRCSVICGSGKRSTATRS
ncbi:MAG: diacylglycerol kinase family protein, partial [Cyanobacteria bacterium J06636_16]